MALNDLQIGQGDILSVEALQEAVSKHNDAITRMEAEHVYDGNGRIMHPTPRWSTAIAYMTIASDTTLIARSGLQLRWARGFEVDPRMEDTAQVAWEIKARGPQLVHVGLEWAEPSFAQSFYGDIRFMSGGVGGRGTLTFSTTFDPEFNPRAVTEGIAGILLVVRAF